MRSSKILASVDAQIGLFYLLPLLILSILEPGLARVMPHVFIGVKFNLLGQ